jgi:hypothetical protein
VLKTRGRPEYVTTNGRLRHLTGAIRAPVTPKKGPGLPVFRLIFLQFLKPYSMSVGYTILDISGGRDGAPPPARVAAVAPKRRYGATRRRKRGGTCAVQGPTTLDCAAKRGADVGGSATCEERCPCPDTPAIFYICSCLFDGYAYVELEALDGCSIWSTSSIWSPIFHLVAHLPFGRPSSIWFALIE